ncbi:sterile alpha motif-like domain-containing protein [Aciduricibacillus chroicocephali]|uniref:Sterile alpha motif-like domain-containing protein n=1 Tax=Aciduricibacillus chroicocephali TaxID=3054939 RepID=A0ABY9KYJ9_9BACI|nr:sterile alpha motif-like domain-containing protein [Bacillaceae bacterium 44XB]
MRSFYQYAKSYRGELKITDEGRLAEWIVDDFDFPKQSTDYDELSEYIEWNSPFPGAASVFDKLWTEYLERR